jgi:hypothetical protein
VEDSAPIHDLQATILNCLGVGHTKLTLKFQGRDNRVTDVAGKLVPKVFAWRHFSRKERRRQTLCMSFYLA